MPRPCLRPFRVVVLQQIEHTELASVMCNRNSMSQSHDHATHVHWYTSISRPLAMRRASSSDAALPRCSSIKCCATTPARIKSGAPTTMRQRTQRCLLKLQFPRPSLPLPGSVPRKCSPRRPLRKTTQYPNTHSHYFTCASGCAEGILYDNRGSASGGH